MVRPSLLSRYVLFCLRSGIKPWHFFQLNAEHFNEEKGMFSKLDSESFIPEQWRLKSYGLSKTLGPERWKEEILALFDFPVFLKPEWGQDAHGIIRIDEPSELDSVLRKISKFTLSYFCQQAAQEAHEYDLFFLRDAQNVNKASIFSVTEVHSNSTDRFPINHLSGIAEYHDISDVFSSEEKRKLMTMMLSLGDLRLARVTVKADSKNDLVKGYFHVVEINMFTPLPMNLCDRSRSYAERRKFLKHYAYELSQTVHAYVKNPVKSIVIPKARLLFALRKNRSVLFS